MGSGGGNDSGKSCLRSAKIPKSCDKSRKSQNSSKNPRNSEISKNLQIFENHLHPLNPRMMKIRSHLFWESFPPREAWFTQKYFFFRNQSTFILILLNVCHWLIILADLWNNIPSRMFWSCEPSQWLTEFNFVFFIYRETTVSNTTNTQSLMLQRNDMIRSTNDHHL